MGLLNYTTSVEAVKTAADIQVMLARHGASEVATAYEGGYPSGIAFVVKTQFGVRGFRVPANPTGALAALRKTKAPPRYQNMEQARRVAWRILKDWLEVQIALVEVGMASLDEVLMPYMLDPNGSGRTIVEAYREHGRAAIEAAP